MTDGGGPTRPVPATPSVTARGGRGLNIITALAQDWGVRDDARGEVTVWVVVHADARHAGSLATTCGPASRSTFAGFRRSGLGPSRTARLTDRDRRRPREVRPYRTGTPGARSRRPGRSSERGPSRDAARHVQDARGALRPHGSRSVPARAARLAPVRAVRRNRETPTMAKKRTPDEGRSSRQLDGRGDPGRRAPASPAPAAPAAATRPVTAGPPRTPSPSWCSAPSRGCPASATGSRCASWCPPPPSSCTLKDGLPEGVPSVTLATVLPMAWPALRRDDGSVLLGLQNDTASGDISRDLADTLQRALTAEPGTPVPGPPRPGRRAAAAGPARPRRRVRASCAPRASSSGFRTRENADRGGDRLPGAGQRRRHPDREARRCRRRLLVRDARTRTTCAGSCRTPRSSCWTRSRGCTPRARSARRRHPSRRLLPRARPDRAGLGPADRRHRGGRREAGGRVRRAARRGAGLGRAADRRRSAGRAAGSPTARSRSAETRLTPRSGLADRSARPTGSSGRVTPVTTPRCGR